MWGSGMSDLKKLVLAASSYSNGGSPGYKCQTAACDYVAPSSYSSGKGRLAAAGDSTATATEEGWARRQLSSV